MLVKNFLKKIVSVDKILKNLVFVVFVVNIIIIMVVMKFLNCIYVCIMFYFVRL